MLPGWRRVLAVGRFIWTIKVCLSAPLSLGGRCSCPTPPSAAASRLPSVRAGLCWARQGSASLAPSPCAAALKGAARPQRRGEGPRFVLLLPGGGLLLWDPRCSRDSSAKVKLLLGIVAGTGQASGVMGRGPPSKRWGGGEIAPLSLQQILFLKSVVWGNVPGCCRKQRAGVTWKRASPACCSPEIW